MSKASDSFSLWVGNIPTTEEIVCGKKKKTLRQKGPDVPLGGLGTSYRELEDRTDLADPLMKCASGRCLESQRLPVWEGGRPLCLLSFSSSFAECSDSSFALDSS